MKIFNITPMGKPRMTRADKWKQREVVMRYRAFCDEVRLKSVTMPEQGGSHYLRPADAGKLESEETKSDERAGPSAETRR